MSNPNNPFLPYLTEENNKNKDNNKNEDNNNQDNNNSNDISKILEEGTTTAAPPPAYEDIVKPPPTQPGYNYQYNYSPNDHQSYPPPLFPPPVAENYNQTPNTYMAANSKNEHRGGCCSNRNKTCGCGWMIVLMIFIILGSISVVNNNVCNRISLGENPVKFSFDPSNYTTLLISADDARIRGGKVRILQNSPTNPSKIVDIEVLTGSYGATPKFDTDTSTRIGIFELKISQMNGFSIFNIPPRCMKSQINVNLPYLPQVDASETSIPNTIQTKNLDFTMIKNLFPYQQNITLITTDGSIELNEIKAQSINIQTDNGRIFGSVLSLSNELSIETDDGDLNLVLGEAQTAFNPKVTVRSGDGDVLLKFNGNSFSGNYYVQSSDGEVEIVNNNVINNEGRRFTGSIGNGNGTLNIVTVDGDIRVEF